MCSNPACSELFDAPDQAVGRKVRCPSCGSVQVVQADGKLAIDPQAAQGPAPSVSAAPAAQPAAPVARPLQAPLPTQEITLEASAPVQAPPPAKPADDEIIDLAPLTSASRKGGKAATSPPGAPAGQGGAFHATTPKKVGGAPQSLDAEIELSAVEEAPAAPKTARHKGESGTAAPRPEPESEIKFSSLLEDVPASAQLQTTSVQISDGVLEHRWAELLIFLLGLAGTAGGLALGLLWLDFHPVVSAYIGALAGWVGGFILAFLIVLAAERGETPKVHCPVCNNVFPADTETCQWCGSALAAPSFNPLAADGMAGGSYALTNLGSIFWAGFLGMAAVSIIEMLRVLPAKVSVPTEAKFGLLAVAGLVALWFLSVLAGFWLQAVRETLSRSRTAPDLPSLWSLGNLGDTFKLLGLTAIYVAPVLLLPLMPLGLLAVAAPLKFSPFNLLGMKRIVGRHAKDFVILWLLILLWLAGMMLAVLLLVAICIAVGSALPKAAGQAEVAIHFVGAAVMAFALTVVACIFCLAMMRCIGMFGRHNSVDLYPERVAGTAAAVEVVAVSEDELLPPSKGQQT